MQRRNSVAATCVYADVKTTPNTSILAADANCAGAPASVCYVNTNCVQAPVSANLTNDLVEFHHIAALGDLSRFKPSTLSIVESDATINLAHFVPPPAMTSLIITSVAGIDLASAKTSLPAKVDFVNFRDAHLSALPPLWTWPASLLSVILDENEIRTFPTPLPPNLKRLSIQWNNVTTMPALPPTVAFVNMYGNNVSTLSNLDLSSVTYLSLGRNPLRTISNVLFSTNMTFFDCAGCPLTNVTLSEDAYNALNKLKAWDRNPNVYDGFNFDTDATVDAAACTRQGGSVKYLWAGRTSNTIQACVLPSSVLPTTTPTTIPTPLPTDASAVSASSTPVGAIVGGVLGGVAVLGLLFCCLFWRKRRSDKSKTNSNMAPTNDTSYQPVDDEDVDLSTLRLVRLELRELSVSSARPLAAGAYGEVWAGVYGGEAVAIKRLKDKSAPSTQQFIDEILLLAKMESPYIVKLVGASWRRLSDLECVVEFMDLGDLRSYLTKTPAEIYPWHEKVECLLSIALGLVYLHTFEPRIIHRDLKSRNVLLDSNKGTKLTDFGSSREIDESTLTNGVGTYQWMAPEIINGDPYTELIDLYAFGVILTEMSTHRVPYGNLVNPNTGHAYSQQFILTNVASGKLTPALDEASPEWVHEIASRCLSTSPADRPTAMQLVQLLRQCLPLV
ncbi:TKL protein kinase [Saprolegnia diclina VS20]|uniref:TKL protein kinase n=1 Tax=Saprolegnia diclina (strain VS20) TaxID=1156394 RepID=T0Q3N2_SAPDV|nr:TKL protein kinase [Saprolegnia diclina VS20]EQC29201.1 TKL protein kinase [Saprolegnia diclina VS20]|eukprot:XP_008617379.1 TKL protein kinase [Saprolegnia diclina VS20]